MHLTDTTPGLFGLSSTFESLNLAWRTTFLGEAGRWSLQDDTLILETQYQGSLTEPQRFRIKELTSRRMVLDLQDAPTRTPDEIVLHRGSSCYASAQWLHYPAYIGATSFGPDGRLHMLIPSPGGPAYAFDHPDQCQPLVRDFITGQAIDVGPDGTVRIARMIRHDETGEPGIYIQEISGQEIMENPIAPRVTKLSDLTTTASYPYLSVSHSADGVPVVTYAEGREVYLWALEGDAWQEHQWQRLQQVTQTPGRVKMQPLPGGGLLGADMVYRDGQLTPWEGLPEHPDYGDPSVFTYDAQGRLYAAFDAGLLYYTLRGLAVARLDDQGAWETTYAGYGEPLAINARADGSVDVVSILRNNLGRAQELLWTHVDPSFAPGAWRGSFPGVDLFFAEARDEARYGMIWATFSPRGGVYLGGGAVGPGTNLAGAVRQHGLEEQEPPRNFPIDLTLTGERPITVDIPLLGERCASTCQGLHCEGACSLFAPGKALLPVHVEHDGEPVRARGRAQLPDGVWPIRADHPWQIDAPLELAEVAHLLDEDDFESARLLQTAAANGDGAFFVLTSGGDRGRYIELRDDAGALLDGLEFDSTGSATPMQLVQPVNGQGATFYGPWTTPLPGYEPPTGVTSVPLVFLNPDLTVRAAVPVPQTNPIPVATFIADDGSLVLLRVRTHGGLIHDITRYHEDGSVEESTVALQGDRLRQTTLGDLYVFATGTPLGEQIEVFTRQGDHLYTLPLRSTLNLVVVPMDSQHFGVIYNGRTGYTWPDDPRFADAPAFPDDRPQLVGLQLRADTGAITRAVLGSANLEPRSQSLLTDDGIIRVEGAGGHLTLESVSWDGRQRHSHFSSRVGGQCVYGTCPGGAVALIPADHGRFHVVFQQTNDRPLIIDAFTLAARWVPAYLRWNAFGD